MPKISDYERYLYYTNNYYLLCAITPSGPDDNTCPDFSPNLELNGKRFIDFLSLLQRNIEHLDSSEPFSNPFNLEPEEDLWESEGVSYYAGELILQPHQRWTLEEQLDLLDTHPMFTGRCPACNRQFPQYAKAPVQGKRI